MPKFRKKPIVIEARQYDGSYESGVAISLWMAGGSATRHERVGDKIIVETYEGPLTASPGDWIIKGVQGEFYPFKPDIFEATYEPAD